MGRFLKDYGKLDKTKAGKMMLAVGKSMSYSGQQRLAIRPPLVRLYQEVETFHDRAIEDTYKTVKKMEKIRTEYRGALMWMKNVSTELVRNKLGCLAFISKSVYRKDNEALYHSFMYSPTT